MNRHRDLNEIAKSVNPIQRDLAGLTMAVWRAEGNDGECPPDKFPTFWQLDDVITNAIWCCDAREEFFQRWQALGPPSDAKIETGGSFTELAHLLWVEVSERNPRQKHPLAPLIAAWQSGPLEVQAVRDAIGRLRRDTLVPRIAMRTRRSSRTDRLYLEPADGDGGRGVQPGFKEGHVTSRIPVLPINLYDLGVQAGEARGGHGAAPIPARMLVKLSAAPSAFVRHGTRFVTYQVMLRDLRNALYPPERLDGSTRKPPNVGRMWPRIVAAIRTINQDAQIPILDSKSGYGHYHQLLRISENFGRIDLDMPIHVILDIPPEVEGGVQLPKRLDQWGAESAPAYRALIGLSFLWHEPGRTHAPKGGRWLRRTGLDPYDPLSDNDVIALVFPSSRHTNRRLLVRRAWDALGLLEEYGELRLEDRRLLPPDEA